MPWKGKAVPEHVEAAAVRVRCCQQQGDVRYFPRQVGLGRPVLVCDRESIVAATGTGKGQLLGRQISDAAARLLAMRGPYTAPETAARRITAFDKGETVLLCVCPIVVQGDVEGGVLLTGRPQDAAPDAETARAVNIAAAFLAKWMEE